MFDQRGTPGRPGDGFGLGELAVVEPDRPTDPCVVREAEQQRHLGLGVQLGECPQAGPQRSRLVVRAAQRSFELVAASQLGSLIGELELPLCGVALRIERSSEQRERHQLSGEQHGRHRSDGGESDDECGRGPGDGHRGDRDRRGGERDSWAGSERFAVVRGHRCSIGPGARHVDDSDAARSAIAGSGLRSDGRPVGRR